MLNALLPLDDDGQITSVEYLTPEMVPENPGKKDSVVDVRSEGKNEANRENALKMKELGIAVEVISQVTGLTTEEIQDI